MRRIVKLYVDEILAGNKTLKDVPAKLKAEVKAELEKLGY